MLQQLRKRLTYANVVSTFTLFIVLGTGTAYATHLIVNSSDVVDESLVSADLRNGLAVKGPDVTDASLTGTDVGNDSLTGADIREGTLGQVRAATLGGLGRSAANEMCNPQSTTYDRCVEVQLNLPSPARVLLNGRLTPTNSGSNSAFAACRWGGVQQSGDVVLTVPPGHQDMSLVGLTDVLPAGRGYTFAIECQGPGPLLYLDAWITAVAISPS